LKPRGGRRPGAGRPKGRKNRKTEERLEHVKELAKAGLTPLEYMLAVMRDEKADEERRLDAAKSAAPYVHPKLAQTELNVKGDLRTMTDDALRSELAKLLEEPAVALAMAESKGNA
jgi:hypothetical protein